MSNSQVCKSSTRHFKAYALTYERSNIRSICLFKAVVNLSLTVFTSIPSYGTPKLLTLVLTSENTIKLGIKLGKSITIWRDISMKLGKKYISIRLLNVSMDGNELLAWTQWFPSQFRQEGGSIILKFSLKLYSTLRTQTC